MNAAAHSLLFIVDLFFVPRCVRCNAKRIQPSKKSFLWWTHSAFGRIECRDGERRKGDKFHGSSKKCGDNTVDGILIMRAKRHRQQSAAKLLSNERETREFNRNQFVRRERHACENKGIFGFGYLPRVIVKNEPQRISLLSRTDGVLHFVFCSSFIRWLCMCVCFFSLSGRLNT